MVPIFKKNDLWYVLHIPLLFAVLFLSRPICLYFKGASSEAVSDLSEAFAPLASVTIIALIIYAVVIGLRIRDRFKEGD